MKKTILALTILSLLGCDDKKPEAASEAKAAGAKEVPSSDEIEKKIEKGVDDVKKNRGPKWKISYEGDLEGEIEGGIMMAIGVSKNITATGAAMNDDSTGRAERSFRVTIMRYGEEPIGNMKLTLPDGTSCSEADPGGDPSKVDLKKEDPFNAVLSGTLVCGKDRKKKITYEAVLNEDP